LYWTWYGTEGFLGLLMQTRDSRGP